MAAILLLSVVVYSSSLDGEILNFDDNQYFDEYPEITDLSWENTKLYFGKHYVLMYHPLPILSFAVQYQLSGLDGTPYHWVNLLFHLLNVLLVYVLGKQILKRPEAALIATLIFAVHPMNTEAVSWISARSSVMYSFFFLASLITYLQFIRAESKKPVWFVVSLVLFALSLFSKVNAAPLPFVLLLFDWFERRKFRSAVILEKLPFLALAIGFGLFALQNAGTTDNLNLGSSQFSFFEGILLSTYSLGFYLIQFFVPMHLSAIHVYPAEGLGPLFYASPLLLAGLSWVVWRLRRERIVLLGMGFFLIIIAITLQVIPSRLFMMADRYCYLPYVGFALIIAHLVVNKPLRQLHNKGYLQPLVLVWCLILAVATHQRNKVWTNTFDLVTDIIDKNSDHEYLARAYAIRAQHYQRLGRANEAIEEYSKALEMDAEDVTTYYNRGKLRFDTRQYKAAEKDFKRALELGGPDHIAAHQSHNFLGGIAFNQNQLQLALKHYENAIHCDSTFAEAYRNRGAIFGQQQAFDKALLEYNNAIAMDEQHPDGYKFRGIVYLKLNMRNEACEDLLAAKLKGAKGVDDLIAKNNCNE